MFLYTTILGKLLVRTCLSNRIEVLREASVAVFEGGCSPGELVEQKCQPFDTLRFAAHLLQVEAVHLLAKR